MDLCVGGVSGLEVDDAAADPYRGDTRHLGFGVGLRGCLGSNHARTMFRIMLELALERMPDFALTDDPDQHRYEDAGTVCGLHSLPATFTTGSAGSG